ncbi:MAG: hypothetical protein ACK41V_16395 [Acidovorax sp.]|uniref:hypothetical protein n=1 Tax=Acidovorax sp. TaxID=1872122 RepID=UPI00391A9BA9
MRKTRDLKTSIATVGVLLTLLGAAAIAADWAFAFKPINAQMAIYSGGLGDPSMPTAQEAKVSFYVQGKAARDLFDHMGPDVKNECSSDPKARARVKGHLQCFVYAKSDYSCYFGFDLKNGKGIAGSIC